MQRPLCTVCNEKPRAYGYKKGTKIYWRSKCDTCIRKQKKLKTQQLHTENILTEGGAYGHMHHPFDGD